MKLGCLLVPPSESNPISIKTRAYLDDLVEVVIRRGGSLRELEWINRVFTDKEMREILLNNNLESALLFAHSQKSLLASVRGDLTLRLKERNLYEIPIVSFFPERAMQMEMERLAKEAQELTGEVENA